MDLSSANSLLSACLFLFLASLLAFVEFLGGLLSFSSNSAFSGCSATMPPLNAEVAISSAGVFKVPFEPLANHVRAGTWTCSCQNSWSSSIMFQIASQGFAAVHPSGVLPPRSASSFILVLSFAIKSCLALFSPSTTRCQQVGYLLWSLSTKDSHLINPLNGRTSSIKKADLITLKDPNHCA